MGLKDFHSYTFFPGQHWSHTWERQHEIVTRFAKELNSQSIFVCSPLGLINHNPFSLSFIQRILHYNKSQLNLDCLNPIENNMKMVNAFHFPFHNRLFGAINYSLMKDSMKMSNNNFFWSTYMNPTLYEFFKRSKFKVYDIAERRSTNPQLSTAAKEWERKAVAEADLVIIDNHVTIEDYKSLNDNIHYIPQGVNVEEFHYIRNNDRKYIGYIGNLHFAIDYDYFSSLIQMNPNEKFLIIGGIIEKKGQELLSFPNVTYIAQIPKSDLCNYLSKMKLGLIPYIINDHTKGVYPTKLFEYLSSGVPVLSTALPEVVQYKNDSYLKISNEPLHLSNLSFNMNDGVEDVIKGNTWNVRWNSYKQYLDNSL